MSMRYHIARSLALQYNGIKLYSLSKYSNIICTQKQTSELVYTFKCITGLYNNLEWAKHHDI